MQSWRKVKRDREAVVVKLQGFMFACAQPHFSLGAAIEKRENGSNRDILISTGQTIRFI